VKSLLNKTPSRLVGVDESRSLEAWHEHSRGERDSTLCRWIATGQLASTADFEASDANRRQAPSRQLWAPTCRAAPDTLWTTLSILARMARSLTKEFWVIAWFQHLRTNFFLSGTWVRRSLTS